jgi:hypothetical protein
MVVPSNLTCQVSPVVVLKLRCVRFQVSGVKLLVQFTTMKLVLEFIQTLRCVNKGIVDSNLSLLKV